MARAGNCGREPGRLTCKRLLQEYGLTLYQGGEARQGENRLEQRLSGNAPLSPEVTANMAAGAPSFTAKLRQPTGTCQPLVLSGNPLRRTAGTADCDCLAQLLGEICGAADSCHSDATCPGAKAALAGRSGRHTQPLSPPGSFTEAAGRWQPHSPVI